MKIIKLFKIIRYLKKATNCKNINELEAFIKKQYTEYGILD